MASAKSPLTLLKVGGSKDCDMAAVAREVAALPGKVIFVHGASQQRDDLAERLGLPTQRIVSPSGVTSVLTDQAALEVLTMAYAGLVNKQWVQAFQQAGVNAVGLCGADGRTWQGTRKKHLIHVEDGKKKLISDTYTGRVTVVDTKLISLLLHEGYLPVLTQPALSLENELINTDNDLAVSALVKALPITQLIFLFGAPGFLQDHRNPKSLISKINRTELDALLPHAHGTMKKKILAAKEALQSGVAKIYWGDSRVKNPVTTALAGKGTIIT